MKYTYTIFLLGCFLFAETAYAGNPDRQGEAGAYELLMNPWARSAGLHTLNTSCIQGVEALRVNPAGLSRINKTEFVLGHTRYLEGTDININALGFAQKVGKSGSFGVSLVSLDVGDLPETTEAQPEGTGATFSPNLFHLGLGYAHLFENKISVGFTFRVISEAIADVSAFGFAFDAGVQYVTGPQDNFKLGVSLRNIGGKMTFRGQGLSFQTTNPDGTLNYNITGEQRANPFEIPSLLNIGISYDFILAEKNRLTLLGNFTSNSFSRDFVGAGLEYSFNKMFMLRGAYRYEVGIDSDNEKEKSVYEGLSAGVSVEVPVKKGSSNRFGIDYAYRTSNPWNGTHNIALRISI